MNGDADHDVDAAVGWQVTAADRAALLRKYQQLAAWRRARDAGAGLAGHKEAAANRAALRALSLEFPGALRELDVLGLPEMARRIDELARPGSPESPAGDDEAWVPWILGYHGLMRAALAARRAGGRARGDHAADPSPLVRTASAAAGVPVDESFLRAAASPPGGRLAVVVLAALARRFNVPASRIASTLFPTRRPSPYQL